MKIAFINPRGNTRNPRPPLGLLFVATVCKRAGHEVKLIDANALDLGAGDVTLLAKDFEVVALTAMTPTYIEATMIADALWDKTIILGGIHASCFPEQCAESGYFDAVVVGEGEDTILEALANLNTEKPRTLCEIYTADKPVNLNVTIPDYSLLDLSLYKAGYPHAQRLPWTIGSTSRGCPYECTFCVRSVSGSRYHYMSAERMLDHIQYLQNHFGIKDITFYDDEFTLSKQRVLDFCSLLIANQIDLTWTCESRVNTVNEEVLHFMKLAGCRMIYYGIESGNQDILNRLNKKQTLSQIRKAIRETREAGILSAGYFMIGCPGETQETIQDSIHFAREIKIDHAQFSICSPMPGSALFDEYVKMGYEVPSWSDFFYLGGNSHTPMFTTEELTRDYLENTVQEANRMFTEKVKA